MSDRGGPHDLDDSGATDDDWADDPAAVWEDAGVVGADAAPLPGLEYVDYQPPMSRGRRAAIVFGFIAAVVVLVAGGLWLWLQRQIDPPGAPGAEVEVEIASGSTTEDIGQTLDDAGVITSASIWNYYTRFKDEGPFQAGLYTFQVNSSFTEAIAVLENGPRPPESYRVTIPEGLTVDEIVDRLGSPSTGVPGFQTDSLRALVESGSIRSQFQPAESTSMEGLLFPETYEVGERTDERTFVQRLVTQLDETMLRLSVIERAAALGVSPYEIIIIGSLIEEEARVDGDRTKIARVIYNRLEQGIPLGIDATNRYEAIINGRDRDDLDFDSDSPYNTRRVAGLPPTPIASPGEASLRAALEPEPGDWIFYVLKNPTEHFFTNSSAEFLRAKAECARQNLGCG